MLSISNALWKLFGAIWAPFLTRPQVGLFLFSVITAVLAMLVWKYASYQKGITRAKDRIKANFLAMVLFGDSLGVLLKSIVKTFGWIFAYLGQQFIPLIIMMIPVLPMLVQIDHLYSFAPLAAGEAAAADSQAQVIAVLDQSAAPELLETPISLTSDGGVTVVNQAVRIPRPQDLHSEWEDAPLIGKRLTEKRKHQKPQPPQILWNIKGLQPGTHLLALQVGEHVATKTVIVGDPAATDDLYQISRKRHDGNFGDSLGFPGEERLTGPIKSIEIVYPRRDGWWWWIVIYLIETLVIAFALKKPFKVDF